MTAQDDLLSLLSLLQKVGIVHFENTFATVTNQEQAGCITEIVEVTEN